MSKQSLAVSRETADAISKEIAAAVRAIITKHGLTVESMKTGYGDYYDFKVKACAVQMKNGVNIESKQARDFVNYSFRWGFETEAAEAALGQTLTIPRLGECVLVGATPKSKTLPIVVLCKKDGKNYGVSENHLKQMDGYDPNYWTGRVTEFQPTAPKAGK